MNYNEFKEVSQHLVSKWRDTYFDSRKLDLIYNDVKDIASFEFQKIVDHFVGEDIRPTRSMLNEQARKFRRRSFENKDHSCGMCSDGGWIVPNDWPIGADFFAYPCVCIGGLSLLIQRLENGKMYYEKERHVKFYRWLQSKAVEPQQWCQNGYAIWKDLTNSDSQVPF